MTIMLSITTSTTTTAITRAVLSTADEEGVVGMGREVVGLETVAKEGEEDGGVGKEVVGLETVAKDEEEEETKWTAVEFSPSMDDEEGAEGICVDVQRGSTHAVVEGCSELGT